MVDIVLAVSAIDKDLIDDTVGDVMECVAEDSGLSGCVGCIGNCTSCCCCCGGGGGGGG